ncbi:MAG: CpsB/CapC family capsule biosynthesis tyrosine phosphatase, partial [Smithella sp.]
MIDFHSHILPGIDDGPETIEESVAMAAALRQAGFKTIYCTPHLMKGCFEADTQTVLSAVSTLQARLNKENIEVEILPGREYYLDEFMESYLQDPLPLGKTQYIMIEIPNNSTAEYVKETCFRIRRGGFIPMIAHPERCRLFVMPRKQTLSHFLFSGPEHKTENSKTEDSALIDYLKEIGCAFQGNLGSFNEYYGPEVKHTAND